VTQDHESPLDEASFPHERQALDDVADWFDEEAGFYGQLVQYSFRSIEPHLVGRSCLELGPAGGAMTRRLVDHFQQVTVVDGSRRFVEAATSLPGVEGHVSLFEEFEPGRCFDTVVMAHVLEHVANPVAILRRVRGWLAPEARAIVIVPNAWSLHRRLGVKLGLLDDVFGLNEQDLAVGHRRIYDRASLDRDLLAAGFDTTAEGGIFLKLLANRQMEQFDDPALVDGMYELGRDLPQMCSEIFSVVRVKPDQPQATA
jgi:SAM-dependent methyltransferase